MKFINNFFIYNLLENFSENFSDNVIKINKETKLFHATGEDFDISKLRGGGYDGVLWTTKDSGISQTYIPVSSTVYTSTDNFIYPPKIGSGNIDEYKNKINLVFRDVEYNNRSLSSYIEPKEFEKYGEEYNKLHDKYYSMLREVREQKEIVVKEKDNNKRNKLLREIYNMEKEIDKIYDKMKSVDPINKKREYVNNYLKKLGYEPDTLSGNNNYKLKIKYENGEEVVLPKDYRTKGRLLILTPKETLNIFNMRTSVEGDLTDLDYHKIDIFRKVEKEGYDGVLINDFAQIESEGNFGHKSIGIFNDSINKLSIDVLNNVEHPDEKEIKRMFRTRNWESKEYKKNKKKFVD